MRVLFGSTAAGLALCLALALPAAAAGPTERDLTGAIDKLAGQAAQSAQAEAGLKGDIEGGLARLEKATQGFVKWDGADQFEVRKEGDAEIADITNAHILIGPRAADAARITLDHLTVRRAPGPDNSRALAFVFPREVVLRAANGEEVKLALKDAAGKSIVDARSGRVREVQFGLAGARLDDKKTGDWITFGPLSLASKLTTAADGSWATPVDLELKGVAFSFSEGPADGTIDRIGYIARSAGPDLAAMNHMRDRLDALQREQDIPPDERLAELGDLLPKLYSLFSLVQGELTVEGAVVHRPKGQPWVSLAKASFGGALTGLSGETAAWRITLKEDGLTLAPATVDPDRVPRHAVLDFGIENIASAALREIIEAALKQRPGASAADKQHAMQAMIGAAATLNPVIRIYDLALDLPKAGVEATAEAKGSPLSPKGYSAEGDVAVRGFATLERLLGDAPLARYLPLLHEIGVSTTAADGSPRRKFHLASALGKWLTINGSDVSAWFASERAAAGAPRSLRPATPAMHGPDVVAVQEALAKAHVAAPHDGSYDAATAVAVARFQRHNALNVDGVVDRATREKLGVAPPPQEPDGPKKGPN
jgi:Putative peptidoglycan binding domain